MLKDLGTSQVTGHDNHTVLERHSVALQQKTSEHMFSSDTTEAVFCQSGVPFADFNKTLLLGCKDLTQCDAKAVELISCTPCLNTPKPYTHPP